MIVLLNCENAVEGASHCAGLVSQNAMVTFTKHSGKYSSQGFKDDQKKRTEYICLRENWK